MQASEVRYAWNGDITLTYQVFGAKGIPERWRLYSASR
jgi:hypothetical protein